MKHVKLFENFNDNNLDIATTHLKDKFKDYVKIINVNNNILSFILYGDRNFVYDLKTGILSQIDYDVDVKVTYNKSIKPDELYFAIKKGDFMDWDFSKI